MNKTILIAIPHHGTKNRIYFFQMLKEFNSFKKYNIFLHVFSTEEFNFDEFDNLTITQHIFDNNIGQILTHKHKSLFYENRNNYDYFMYCEDDVLITESIMDAFVEEQNNLPVQYICGFLRYELKENNSYKFLCDSHPCHSIHRGGYDIIKNNYILNNKEYFEPYNIHQASYVIPKNIFNNIPFEKYLSDTNNYVGILEGAASNIFFKCGLTRVIPRDKIKKLLIHHLPNTYVKKFHEFYTEESTLDENKLKEWQK